MNSYTWDRANRLLSMGGVDYQYDGEGRRVQQTVSSVVTKYLLDIQPGLAVVLSDTTGANTMRYVHSPRGIHAHKDTGGNWEWMVQDGLGNVREVVDNSVGVLESRNYDPYGNPFGATGTSQTGYGFTGELVDGSGLLDLRARRYNTGLGTFASLDPFEGMANRAMSLNGYSWVEGNVPNTVDPSGNYGELPSYFAPCQAGSTDDPDACDKKCKDDYDSSWGRGFFDYQRCLADCNRQRTNNRRDLLLHYGKSLLEKVRNNSMFFPYMLGQPTDLDALAMLIDYDATFGVSAKEISDDISYIVTYNTGSATIFTAAGTGIVESISAHYIKLIPIGDWRDTGFNPDYQDHNNQVFHVWAYINTTAQGGDAGVFLSKAGNYAHEEIGWPDGWLGGGASIQDERLAYIGMALGLAINEGYIQAQDMGATIKPILSSPFPIPDVSDPSVWFFTEHCEAAQHLIHFNPKYCQPDVSKR